MAINVEQIEQPVQMPTQNIIIIQPGSLYVKIGRASDLNPCVELHAIARRRYPGGLIHRDPILPPLVPNMREVESEMDPFRLQVSHSLGSYMMSYGQRRYITPPQQISAFNKRVQPEVVSDYGSTWIKLEDNVNEVYGDSLGGGDRKNKPGLKQLGDLTKGGTMGGKSTVCLRNRDNPQTTRIRKALM